MTEGSRTIGQGKITVLALDQPEHLADMAAAWMVRNPVHTTETLPNIEGNEECSQKGI